MYYRGHMTLSRFKHDINWNTESYSFFKAIEEEGMIGHDLL